MRLSIIVGIGSEVKNFIIYDLQKRKRSKKKQKKDLKIEIDYFMKFSFKHPENDP